MSERRMMKRPIMLIRESRRDENHGVEKILGTVQYCRYIILYMYMYSMYAQK